MASQRSNKGDEDFPGFDMDQFLDLFHQGRYAELEVCAGAATIAFPQNEFAWQMLGMSLQQQGRAVEALLPMQKAVDLSPEQAELHNSLGVTYQALGNLFDAEKCYRRALQITPGFAEAFNNLGVTLQMLGRAREAEDEHRHALKIRPNWKVAHNDLGNALMSMGRLIEAEASYRRALQIDSAYAKAHSNLANSLTTMGRLDEAEIFYRYALKIKPDSCETYSDLLFALNYNAAHSPAFCLEEARRFGRMAAEKIPRRFTSWICPDQPVKLRLGLVSGDLRNHPVGYFLAGFLPYIDPSRIELIAYPTHSRTDLLTDRLRAKCIDWKSIVGYRDESAARIIQADGIHILLDLAGHSAHNRLPIFAWKPAPIQVSWLGYFATTGLMEVDYVLADETVLPTTEQHHFTESIFYLPETRLCFTAPTVDINVAPLPSLTKGNITFASFQNLSKIGDWVLDVWGRILALLPNARLRIQCKQLQDPAVAEIVVRRFQNHGIAPHRLILRGPMRREAYLAAYGEVDVILDTFPYPGGTTTCEALWMGVPTLTLCGQGMLARQGAGLLTAAGLPEWVATSVDDYVEKAITLTSDLAKLASLRENLRRHVAASSLFDGPRFARDFETALWDIWKNHQRQIHPSTPV